MVDSRNGLRLNLLGEFSLRHPDGVEIDVPGQRKKALIVLLALSPNKEASREKIISTLWSKRSQGQARASLRTLLNELNRLFAQSNFDLVLKNQARNSIRLNTDQLFIDTERLLQVTNAHTLDRRLEALDVYQGDLYQYCKLRESVFQDWLNLERIQQREIFRDNLQELLEHFAERSNHEWIMKISNRLLKLESTDEKAHAAIMRSHANQGDKAAALKQYQTCSEATMELLNESPSIMLTQLRDEIKRTNHKIDAPSIANHPEQSLLYSNSVGLSVGIAAFKSPESIQTDIDQISTDVINALTRFKWISVIPQGTTSSYRNQGLSAVEIGRILKIQYIIDGQGRLSGGKSKLSVELIDIIADTVLWGDSFKLSVPYEISVSEMLVGKIVNQIETRLRANEVRRILGDKNDNPSAYDCAWHAISSMYEMTEAAFESAKRLFEKAERENIQYAPIYSWWAMWQIFCVGQGWARSPKTEGDKAFKLACKANRIDNDDALALAIMGHCEAFLNHNFEAAKDCFDESLFLNPNSAFAWTLSSATYSYSGEADEALRRLDHAENLCPLEPHFGFLFDTAKTIAYTFDKNYVEAVRWGRKTIRKSPHFSNGYKPLIASLGHLGEISEAREFIKRLLELEADFSVERFVEQYPFKLEKDRETYIQGLIKAGVPKKTTRKTSVEA